MQTASVTPRASRRRAEPAPDSCHAVCDVNGNLVAWLVRFGAPLLFFAQVFGIFGVPIPDELLLTAAGALIASGRLNATSTVVAAISGCLTGITLSYALGRWVGLPVLRARMKNHQDTIERAQSWFRRFGGWLLTFGYFVPGVRHVTAIAAGSGCLNYRTFVAYAYPGGVIWCAVFLGFGYVAGDRWLEIATAARGHMTRIAIVVAAAIAAYAAFHVAARRRT
jgi:membrane protein DedA with SNARE-associated domain